MQHQMNLKDAPFCAIKNKTKTVEMRLFDERRRNINVGDSILFTNRLTNEQLTVQVLALDVFPSFVELYARFDKISIGYTEEEIARPSDMLQFYSNEDIQKYGVLAITVKVVEQ